ncbi:MAG: FecR domain-containing protein, partial [Planctomycetes bacterium]|nr:FecR domain-containing protein [Planctomycetota bacterium]
MSSEPHVARLVTRHLEGRLSAAETRELEALLERSESAREMLARAVRLEMDLLDLHGAHLPRIPSRYEATRWRRSWWLAVAALLLGLWFLNAWMVERDHTHPGRVDSGKVLMHGTENVTWIRDGERHLALPGARIALHTADVTFRERSVFSLHAGHDSGSLLGSEPTLDLEAGAVLVETRDEGPSPRLTLRTPQGTLRDIGTRFEVDLSRARGTEDMLRTKRVLAPSFLSVLVLTGLVQFAPSLEPEALQELSPTTGR